MRLPYPPKPHSVLLMGVLNITPDSFSDGGIYFANVDAAVSRAKEMLAEGADIIDIGGESTRPGAQAVEAAQEMERVIPVITALRKSLGDGFPISIDTYKSPVAQAALEAGATMVNSVGGLQFDPVLADVVASFDCPLIIYHIKGTPRTMQQGEIVYKDVVADITKFFEEQIALGMKKGIKRDQFILDPGIGFGKTVAQNVEIIKRLSEFHKLDLPLLIGVSRKSHLGLLLKEKLHLSEVPSPNERLEAALAETAIAVYNGASIVRTHDVAATKKCVLTVEALL